MTASGLRALGNIWKLQEQRASVGIYDTTLRLSVGVEDVVAVRDCENAKTHDVSGSFSF